MKRLALLLTLLLLVSGLTGCASPEPAAAPDVPDSAEAAAIGTETAAADGFQNAVREEGLEYLSDFTVQCIDGSAFTLSKALREHELAVINIFFSHCPPCAMEFPFLQEAWSQNADKIAVIALSVDPDDTDEVLRDYAESLGLSFPIGHTEGTDLARFVTVGYPTSLLVDPSGRVAAVESGAKRSTQEFLDWFAGYTGENYDPDVCTYTVYCYDSDNYEGVEGVIVNFCTDTTCTPVTTAEQGMAVFTGLPASYHVQIVKVPGGRQVRGSDEWYTEPYAETYWIPFSEAAE